ncbi:MULTISPECIES: hypothetical protein [unclassified Mesorhizobium]|uniref:hypothetical protein n=1 Tax=unclassified Mesorhizobium TaxID=325217 RepID=UPI001FEF3DFF|nr:MULTISPECIES: hypothetical protein [unclassified Mesorhizobium]
MEFGVGNLKLDGIIRHLALRLDQASQALDSGIVHALNGETNCRQFDEAPCLVDFMRRRAVIIVDLWRATHDHTPTVIVLLRRRRESGSRVSSRSSSVQGVAPRTVSAAWIGLARSA